MTETIDLFAPITGKEIGLIGMEDWVYKDVPWTTKENWEELFSIISPEKPYHHFLAVTVAGNESPSHAKNRILVGMKGMIRGQVLISPEGFDNLRNYLKKLKEQ